MPVLNLAVLISALGYFVDVFDLFLFSLVRQQSLYDFGFIGTQNMAAGIRLLNAQMLGLLVGGFFWGIMADRLGRTKILFSSIFIYSIANLMNAFVTNVELYQTTRLIAGFGLSGELGVAVTLVSEVLPKGRRGLGTALVASLGFSGSLAAAFCAKVLPWRYCYFLGGSLGFVLLFLRIRVTESHLFKSTHQRNVYRGNLFKLFSNPQSLKKYLRLVLVGTPIWFVTGVILTFMPEFAQEMGLAGITVPETSILFYSGIVIGDMASGLLSQFLKSRKKAINLFILGLFAIVSYYLQVKEHSIQGFYTLVFFMGLTTGYWAVLIAFSSEQFGTNLRATVTTSVPNLVRGSVIPMMFLFQILRARLSLTQSAQVLTMGLTLVALLSVYFLSETFTKDLDFIEV